MKKNSLPPNWDEKRIQRVLKHYENLSEEEVLVEDEIMWEDPTQTVMEIPTALVPVVRELIAKHQDT